MTRPREGARGHVCDGSDPSCAACQAMAHRLDVLRVAMTLDDRLDDIRRARIWTQIEDRLAEPRRSRWPIAIGGGAALAVAAVAALLVLRAPPDGPHLLAVPADTKVSSQLGPHTAASIVGPAELDILATAGEATSVRLRSGTMLAEFAGGGQRSLRIEAPGAVIEVVGTLFAVEIRGGVTCTSVAHGRVRVTTRAGAAYVDAGQRQCTGAAVVPISSDMRDALARHGAAIVARGEAPAAAVASSTGRPEPASIPSAPPAVPAPLASVVDAAAPAAAVTVVGSSAPVAAGPAPAAAAPTMVTSSAPVVAAAVAPSAPVAALTVAPRPTRANAPPPAPPEPLGSAALPDPPRRPAAAAPSLSSLPSRPEQRPGPPSSPSVAPAASAPAVEPVRPAPPSADDLYRAAEAALAARNPAAADRVLAQLIAEHPTSPLIDQAHYERARIAYRQRAWPAARSQLAQLAAIPHSPLAEPGRYLQCRIAVESRDAAAAACLTDYRAAYPRGAHDLDVLALLVQLAHASAGCPAAAALIDELAQSYPRTTLAAAWRARCSAPGAGPAEPR